MSRAAELPNWPAAMPLNLAAAYCGLSVDVFKETCPIKPIPFTLSTKGNRYLRHRLDEWLLSRDPNPSKSPGRKSRAIALELGGDLGEKIKADEQRRADEAAERAESEKVSEDERRQEEIDLLAQLKAKYENE